MISHEIIVVKPTVYQSSCMPSQDKAYPDIKSQEDLDNWLKNTPFKVGCYVTFMQQPLMSTAVPHSVYELVELCTDYSKMQRTRYLPFHPQLVKIKSLPSLTYQHATHARWDDIRNLRALRLDEYDNLLVPYLDRLRNHSQPQT